MLNVENECIMICFKYNKQSIIKKNIKKPFHIYKAILCVLFLVPYLFI